MGNGWSSQYLAVLILPGGATSGARLVLDGIRDAILEYNAANQLVGSWAASGGNDGLGNDYDQGFTIGVPNGPQVIIQLAGDGHSGLIFFPTGNTGIDVPAAMQAFQQNGTGAASYDQIQLFGAQNSAQLDSVVTTWLSSSTDGTQDPMIQEFYHDPSGTFHLMRATSYRGAATTGAVTGVQPGTGISRAAPAVAESWHTAVLTTAFTTNVQDQAPRYTLEGIGGGRCRLDGVAYTTAAIAGVGQEIFTVGAAYAPATRKRFIGVTNATGYTAAGQALVMVQPASAGNPGAVLLEATAGAAGEQVILDGMSWPLD